ncbi:MAG: hypothetical protein HC811_13365 [Flammeovirgaceae bacterium]|nr:hypothetical protein [Flammeovirgaceae bacterium]
MEKSRMRLTTLFFLVCCVRLVTAQNSDDYTRYELLDLSSHSFRILYEVTITAPGTTFYYNTLRKGSQHKVDAVVDLASGKPLSWLVVNGVKAKEQGHSSADPDTDYLQVRLNHPVSENSEYRILIDKTYMDAESYFSIDDKIVFHRSLGIKRNSVILPLGYEVVSCNYPVQVMMEKDGRLKLSFVNRGPVSIPVHIEGKKLDRIVRPSEALKSENIPPGQGRDKSKVRIGFAFPERAHQTREIVYFLQQPETNSFRLYHDYTEVREGVRNYLNVVRAGSKASNPSAINLDTGLPLKVETLRGKAIIDKGIDIGNEVNSDTEVIVIWFEPVKKGESTRIRIEETYTDPARYIRIGDELIWDRALGRVHNTVVLPEGWWLTANSIPATIQLNDQGLVQLYYLNDSPDDIDVYLKGLKK